MLHIVELAGGPCLRGGLPPAARAVAASPTGTGPGATVARTADDSAAEGGRLAT